ncbi:hypothetical protein QNN00_16560 [Bacillus velezensis]|nr:hypothetical protein [Bacillus velezensis]
MNGKNIYPHDIERVAIEMEEVDLGRVAACGVYDQRHKAEKSCSLLFTKNHLKNSHRLSKR